MRQRADEIAREEFGIAVSGMRQVCAEVPILPVEWSLPGQWPRGSKVLRILLVRGGAGALCLATNATFELAAAGHEEETI